MKKRYLIPLSILLVLLLGYLLGPRVHYAAFDSKIPKLDIPLSELEARIANTESKVINLKPDNQSRIVWADSIRKTPYSIIYLHGFSASPKEGDPIHREFAKKYGANLYIPRLAGHGIQDDNSFKTLSPKDLVDSAKDAIAIGRLLGEKVILLSCSTGSTLALYLAAEHPDAFHGLLMYSPNIDLHDSNSKLLIMPWGQQLTSMMLGEYHTIENLKGTPLDQYWTTTYSNQGLICLKYLLAHSMTEERLAKVKTPFLLAYYYKDETHFDNVVSIDKMKWFHNISATPAAQKRLVALSDVGGHVMVSGLQNKNLESVREISFSFAEEILGLRPKY